MTVEESDDGLAAGIDVLELKRLEASGISTNLALEVMAIAPKVIDGTATPEEIVRGKSDFDTIADCYKLNSFLHRTLSLLNKRNLHHPHCGQTHVDSKREYFKTAPLVVI